jgi:hypothetical protein
MQYIQVNSDCLVATDGLRLIVFRSEIKIDTGLYFLTQGRWLLPARITGQYPKWKSIILSPQKKRVAYKMDNLSDPGQLLWAINRETDSAMSLELFLPVTKALLALNSYDIRLVVGRKTKTGEPIQIEGKSSYLDHELSFTYVQMPISTANIITEE